MLREIDLFKGVSKKSRGEITFKKILLGGVLCGDKWAVKEWA